MASLHARSATSVTGGRGQVVDVAITEAVMAVMESVVSEYSATGVKRTRTGSILPGIAPSNLYPTKDGDWVVIGANADGVFRRLAAAMDRPDLADDPRYATHRARGANQQDLDGTIAAWTEALPAAVLVERLTAAGVPAGPVYDAAGVAQDPHFRDREAVIEMETEDFGVLTMQGVFPRFSETPGSVRWPGPALGQHNEEIYGDLLGFSAADIARLRERGVL
jgi:crotonobetainyl-CoA:carnitine CoA-transferase CaiB-like acyl-CoA transferase